MGAFKIEIVGVGGHGCERKAKPGEKLYQRCGRFTCPDCAAFDFTQRMRQAGMVREGDSACSVTLDADTIQRLKDRGLLDGLDRQVNEDYVRVEITAPEFLPDGASHVFVARSAGKIEAWAQYPQKAEFTHWPGQASQVVDDMLKNERKSGSF